MESFCENLFYEINVYCFPAEAFDSYIKVVECKGNVTRPGQTGFALLH